MTHVSLAPPLVVKSRRSDADQNLRPVGLCGTTLVRTIMGLRPINRLMAGDLLLDAKGQIIELRGLRKTRLRKEDCIVMALPPSRHGTVARTRAWIVGAGQKIEMADWRSDLLYGKAALTSASALVDATTIRPAPRAASLYQLEFDGPQVISANGYNTLIPGSH